MSELGLADAIGQLRREIGQAMVGAKGESLQFLLGPVDLELQVQLVLKGGAKAEAKWLVVSIGAEAGVDRTRSHKVNSRCAAVRRAPRRCRQRPARRQRIDRGRPNGVATHPSSCTSATAGASAAATCLRRDWCSRPHMSQGLDETRARLLVPDEDQLLGPSASGCWQA
jgi:hypothetical protein